MTFLRSIGGFFVRLGILVRASLLAVTLGILETFGSARGRRALALLTLGGVGVFAVLAHPVRSVPPGAVGVRSNRFSGALAVEREGVAVLLPIVHDFRLYDLRDRVYHPARSARADGEAPFQSVEGLSLGVDVAVRYALDADRIDSVARRLPADVGAELVEPIVDGVLHRIFAEHTVREVFSTKRMEIQKAVEEELRPLLAKDGVLVRSVFIGNVDLPKEYRAGLEALLTEELSAEKMRFTLELKEKQVKQSALEAEAEKARREKAAEAAGEEEVIAAKAKEEAMRHVLPFKEKEIEQRRLEAEASKVSRLKQAEAEAEARRIESAGEADSRRKLAESDAYRMEVTGRAASEQLARESDLIAKNPLLIQKTFADKLADKIQVIVAPPAAGGFFAGGLIGSMQARTNVQARTSDSAATAAQAGDDPEERQ
jgi:regulator of protease activity HflC (stomatin/prohibitin superfamily)